MFELPFRIRSGPALATDAGLRNSACFLSSNLNSLFGAFGVSMFHPESSIPGSRLCLGVKGLHKQDQNGVFGGYSIIWLNNQGVIEEIPVLSGLYELVQLVKKCGLYNWACSAGQDNQPAWRGMYVEIER